MPAVLLPSSMTIVILGYQVGSWPVLECFQGFLDTVKQLPYGGPGPIRHLCLARGHMAYDALHTCNLLSGLFYGLLRSQGPWFPFAFSRSFLKSFNSSLTPWHSPCDAVQVLRCFGAVCSSWSSFLEWASWFFFNFCQAAKHSVLVVCNLCWANPWRLVESAGQDRQGVPQVQRSPTMLR